MINWTFSVIICSMLLNGTLFHCPTCGLAILATGANKNLSSLTAANQPRNISATVPVPSVDNQSKHQRIVNLTAVNITRQLLRNGWLAKLPQKDDSENTESQQNIESNTGYPELDNPDFFVEGDIMGMDKDIFLNMIEKDKDTLSSATQDNIWPNGIVPWVIKSGPGGFSGESGEKFMTQVREAIKTIEDNTCVRFKEMQFGDANLPADGYVTIVPSMICASYVGRRGGQQVVTYDTAACRDQRSILHELMHALGSMHEMSRTDRDDYIEVNTANIIKPEFDLNFKKYRDKDYSAHRLQFDSDSVMMYKQNQFAKDKNSWTIRLKGNSNGVIGNSNTLTDSDIFAINDQYQCKVPNCEDRQNGRFAFNNKCYFISSNQTLNYSSATAACAKQNGRLANIPPKLVDLFFDQIDNETIATEIYLVAGSSKVDSDVANDGNSENPACTAIISKEIFARPCTNFDVNYICEVVP